VIVKLWLCFVCEYSCFFQVFLCVLKGEEYLGNWVVVMKMQGERDEDVEWEGGERDEGVLDGRRKIWWVDEYFFSSHAEERDFFFFSFKIMTCKWLHTCTQTKLKNKLTIHSLWHISLPAQSDCIKVQNKRIIKWECWNLTFFVLSLEEGENTI